MKFFSDLKQVSGFLRALVSSTNITDHHDIIEILLKVALNTIKSKPNQCSIRDTQYNVYSVTLQSSR